MMKADHVMMLRVVEVKQAVVIAVNQNKSSVKAPQA